MFKHIVGWNINEEYQGEERDAVKAEMKRLLCELPALIPEIKEMEVHIDLVEGSTSEVVLDTTFESQEGFLTYRDHAEHVRVGKYIRAVVRDRACFDYWL